MLAAKAERKGIPSCQLPGLKTGIDSPPERSGDELGGILLQTGATGVPRPENILRGIHVRMIAVSAEDAPERGLLRTVLRPHVSADETDPARVPWIDPKHAAALPLQLILQEGEEHSPPLGQDGAVQSGLLPDLPAGVLPGATGASGHVPDLQVLDVNHGLGFADRSRGLVEKIQTHVRDPFVGSRHPALLLPEMVAPPPLPVFPGKFPLLPGKLLFGPLHGFCQIRSRVDPGAVRQSGEGDDPEVQADLPADRCNRFRGLGLGLEGDRPPAPLPGDGGVSELPRDLPGDPDLDPPHIGEEDPGEEISSLRIPGREIELHLERIGIVEGIPLLLLEPGESLAVRPVQSLPNGQIEVLQGLLLWVDRTVGEKPAFLARPPQGQEFGQISIGQERDPGFEPPPLEVEGLVPNEPHTPRMAGQEIVLFGSRNETEFERLNGFHAGNYNWPHGKVNRTQTWKTLRFQDAWSLGLCHKILSRGGQQSHS